MPSHKLIIPNKKHGSRASSREFPLGGVGKASFPPTVYELVIPLLQRIFHLTRKWRLKILWFDQWRDFETATFLAQNAHQLNAYLVFLWFK